MDELILVILRQNETGNWMEDEVAPLTTENLDSLSKRAQAKSVLCPAYTYILAVRRDYELNEFFPYINYVPELESRTSWKAGNSFLH